MNTRTKSRKMFSKQGIAVLIIILIMGAMAIAFTGCGGGGGGGTVTTSSGGTIIDGTTPPGAPRPDGALKQYVNTPSYSPYFLVDGPECKSLVYTINGGSGVTATSNNTAARLFITFNLVTGKNEIALVCINSSGKESSAYTFSIVRDNTAPNVNITSTLLTEGDSLRTANFSLERNSALLLNINGLGDFQIKNPDSFTIDNYTEIANYPMNFYLSTGSNNVSFRARDYAGNYSSYLSRTLNGATIAQSGPRLSSSGISVSPTSGTTNTTFNISNTCSANCTNITYAVRYGDNPAAAPVTTASSSHQYSTPGIYQISVGLTSSSGTNNYTKVVVVYPLAGTICNADGFCGIGENHDCCPGDCPTAGQSGGGTNGGNGSESCGNGVCEGSETCSSCSSDCGSCGTNCNNNGICDSDESYSSCSNDCEQDNGINPLYSYYIDSAATRIVYDSVNGNGIYYVEAGHLYRKDIPSGNMTGSWRLDNQGTLGLPAIITDVTGIAVGNNKLFIADGGTKLIYAFNIISTTNLVYTYIAGIGMNLNNLSGIDYYNGKLYVVDSSSSNGRVVIFNTSNGSHFLTFGSSGDDEGEFSSNLRDITVDGSRETIYVADNGNRKIVAFDLGGTFLRETTGLPLIGSLKARNISSLGSLLVFTDASGYRAYGYTDNGTISWLWTLNSNSQNGSFQNAYSVSWNNSTSPNSNGQLLISDSTKGKIQVFTLQQ